MSPLRWWILFGWFPLFWFWNTPQQIRTTSRGARIAGGAGSVSFVFFFLFLLLALFDPVGGVVFFTFMYIFFLCAIVIVWIFGCCNIGYFNDESDEDEIVIGPYTETDKKDDDIDMKKMPTQVSTNLKSLKMQL